MNNDSAHSEIVDLESRVISAGNELSRLIESIYEHKLEIKRYNAQVNNDLSMALIVDRNMDVYRYVNSASPEVESTVVGAGFVRLKRMKDEQKHLRDFYETSRSELLRACEDWESFVDSSESAKNYTCSEEFKKAYESRLVKHDF